MRHEFSFCCTGCRRVVATATIDGEHLGAGTSEVLTDIYCAACVVERERTAVYGVMPPPHFPGRGGTYALALATAILALVFGLVVGAGPAHADEVPPLSPDVLAWSDYARVDVLDLQGAVNSTGLTPEEYLVAVGDVVKQPEPLSQGMSSAPAPAVSGRVACIIQNESRGDPGATNAGSGAAGLGQFLASTWATTPQGKAGLSPYNAAANRAAIQWMIDAGRAKEFDAVRYYGC